MKRNLWVGYSLAMIVLCMPFQTSAVELPSPAETSICSPVGNWTLQNPVTIDYLKKMEAAIQTLFSGIKPQKSSISWRFIIDRSGNLTQSIFSENASSYNQVLMNRKSVKFFPLPEDYPEPVACFKKTFLTLPQDTLSQEEQEAKAIKWYGDMLRMMSPHPSKSSPLDVGYVQLDSQGVLKFVIPPQFSAADYFQDGHAIVSKGGEKFLRHSPQFLIDTKGNKISGDYDTIERFEYAYAPVTSSKKWGIINASGKLVVPTLYDQVFIRSADLESIR